jgi:hypothetical protein
VRTLARVRPAAVLLATVALAAAGCTGSDAEEFSDQPPVPPPTSASTTTDRTPPPADTAYARQLDRLCRRNHAAHSKVGQATSPAELAKRFPQTAAIDRRFARDILRIAAPKGKETEAGRLAGLYTAISRSQDTALGFLRSDSIDGYFQHISAALELRTRAERLAKQLGAPACAVRPPNL